MSNNEGKGNVKEIRIEWLWDQILEQNEEDDCDDLVAWGEGAKIYLDGVEIISMIPHASLEGSTSYGYRDVYAALFSTHLGIWFTDGAWLPNPPANWDKQTYQIKWLSDKTDCETCGADWAGGAEVTDANGEKIILLEPLASCFGGCSYDEQDVYRCVLQHLGYTLIEKRTASE